ncbi:MAG: DUF4097 family beta strand repeat protein [Armatimonadota bacterium]|nr:MAG: DUF4097 family beta strand repeat protein [Armatimonadota bacterium]
MRARIVLSVILVLAVCYALVRGREQPAGRASEDARAGTAAEEAGEAARISRFEVARSATTFDLGESSELIVANPFGDVEVVAGGPEVRVETVTYALGRDMEEARRRARALGVSEGPDGAGGHEIIVQGETSNSSVRMDLAIAPPAEAALKVRRVMGKTRVVGLKGPIEIRGESGEISVESIDGSVTVESTSGDIGVRAARGGVDVHTGGGDVSLESIRGPVLARTMNGNIRLGEAASDRITATTRSGDVEIRLSEPFSGEMEARTQSGHIVIALSAGSNCRVRTATGSGEISSALPLRAVSHQGRNISGRLGAGEGAVEVTTGSGDIRLVAVD